MYKVITIENKPIPMKSDGGTARLYRQYFKKDFLTDISNAKKSVKDGKINDGFSAEFIENLAWVMAKRADESMPDIDEWLQGFEDPFSLINKAKEIFSLLKTSETSIVKPKKKKSRNQKNR